MFYFIEFSKLSTKVISKDERAILKLPAASSMIEKERDSGQAVCKIS